MCTDFITSSAVFQERRSQCKSFHPLRPGSSWCPPSTTLAVLDDIILHRRPLFSQPLFHRRPSVPFSASVPNVSYLQLHPLFAFCCYTSPPFCCFALAVFHGLCCMGFLEKFARVSVTFLGCQLLREIACLAPRVECLASS